MDIQRIIEQTSNHEIGKLLENQINVALTYWQRQTDIIDASKYINFETVSSLELPMHPAHQSELRKIYTDIKTQSMLTTHPVNAFLTSFGWVAENNHAKAYLIQAHILIAVAALNKQKGYNEVIKRALDACRLIFIDKLSSDLINRLPCFTSPIHELIEQLGNLIARTEKKEGKHYLYSINALMKNFEKNAPQYRPRDRKPKPKLPLPENNLPDYEQTEHFIKRDDDEAEVVVLFEKKSCSQDYQNTICSNENAIDQQSSARYLDINFLTSDDVKASLGLLSQQAKYKAQQIYRREKQLYCDYRQLTNHDVTCLVNYCFDHLDEHKAYTYLLAILFTGRNINTLIKDNTETVDPNTRLFCDHPMFPGHSGLTYQPPLTAHNNIDESFKQHIQRSDGKVLLFLPKQLTPILQLAVSAQQKEEINTEISKILHNINKKNNTRLTIARIENFISFYLKNQNVDSTEIALIIGKQVLQEAGCYYYQTNIMSLVTTHQNYVSEILKLAQKPLTHLIDKTSQKLVGSNLQIKQEKLKELFIEIKNNLTELRRPNNQWFEEFHNVYVTYIILMLNISTGHRPVCHPYERLDTFDLIAGTLFISDKEVRHSPAHRILPLPQLAIEQVKQYINHLKKIHSILAPLNTESRENIKLALNSQYPFFFFLENEQTIPVTPLIFKKQIQDILPIPLNWNRHFMRTWLRQQNIPGHVVNHWMGHLGIGCGGSSKYNATSMADLKIISTKINHFLTETLALTTEQSWMG
jgi:hypothetical protein